MNARTRQIILRSLRQSWRSPLRSALLMLSATTGVIGVICSVNYGAGGTKQVLDEIRRMGTNVLIITPAESRVIAGRARTGQPVTTLVAHDLDAIRRDVTGQVRSSAFVSQSFWLKAADLSKNTPVVGCEPDYFGIKNWPTADGVVFDDYQERLASRVVLLGNTAARDLFGNESPIGERLLINRVPFEVIGVLQERGQGLDVSNEDSQVYVPLTTAMRRVMNVDHYTGIILEVDSLGAMDETAAQIRALLREHHHMRPGQPNDFQVQNQKTLLDTQLRATNRLNFFLWWIGASALVVSTLGMFGITWIAVEERTREFGTRRALGATSSDIFLQVVSEATMLTLAGCLAGLCFSWPLSWEISRFAGVTFVFRRGLGAVVFVAATGLNIGFAFLPSRRAARLAPTEALRYE